MLPLGVFKRLLVLKYLVYIEVADEALLVLLVNFVLFIVLFTRLHTVLIHHHFLNYKYISFF